MKNKITHADRMRWSAAFTMYRVMELLEWDLLTYNMFKYECGRHYLEVHLRGDIDAIEQMERSIAYWGWWRLHWYIREQEFITRTEQGRANGKPWYNSENFCVALFKIVNNPVDLALSKSPEGKRLEDSYCKDLAPTLR